jgi:diacylglycerol O-acyltransferase
MHVAGLSIFGARADGSLLTYDDVERVVEARLRLAPRLRRKLRSVPGNLSRPVWIDDDRFDLDFHLRRASVPAPGGRFELERAVGRVLSRPLDRTKPLWELYVFEDLSEDRTAILLKIHHAMADGIGNMMIASALFDLTADAPTGEPDGAWSAEPAPPMQDLIRDAVEDAVLHPIQSLAHVARQPRIVAETVSATADALRTVAGMGTAPRGPFDGSVGPNRRFATTERPFAVFRGIKESLGGTVNDVVLTAITNGFRELLLSRGESVEGRTVRTLVPVSVRATRSDGAAAGDGTFNNKVSMLFAALPVGIVDPSERLAFIREQLAGLKQSNQAVAGEALTSMSALAPDALVSLAARAIARVQGPTAVETVTTNVPGPQLPLYSLGRRMRRVYAYVPIAAQMRFGVTIFSYDGEVTFGVTGDHDASPDVDVLAGGISDGLANLVKIANRGRAQKAKSKARA